MGRKKRKPDLFGLIFVVVFATFTASSFAAPPAEGRTLKDLSETVPLRVLQRSISPRFYKSLLISPIDGWVVVRARLSHTRLFGARVIRSSLGGAYDSLALAWAEELRIAGSRSPGNVGSTEGVLMHLLIYHIADGTMFLFFPSLEQPGGEQMRYFGCARLSVLKKDGQWVEIKGPEGLQGKGWAVRENRVRTFLSGERLPRDYQASQGMGQQ